jgi:hypothetical protein
MSKITEQFEQILEDMVDIAPCKIHKHLRPYILEAMQLSYDIAKSEDSAIIEKLCRESS